MSLFLSLVVHSVNVLGIFADPFEFEGDYGPEANPVREKVFELVVPRECLARNITQDEILFLVQKKNHKHELHQIKELLIAQAILEDHDHGPTLSELLPSEVILALIDQNQKSSHLGFSELDLENFLQFVQKYGKEKIFRFFKHAPPLLLSLDKGLRDQAAREGKNFTLPILGSTEPLHGRNATELKMELLDALFNDKTSHLTKPSQELKNSLELVTQESLQKFLGPKSDPHDLMFFSTAAGQILFYWLYHSLDLHLVSEKGELIGQINQVKQNFSLTIGDPKERAKRLKKKLFEANTALLFTQESDTALPKLLLQDDFFLPIEKQNPLDGCFIFLRKDIWMCNPEMIPLSGYPGYQKGKVNLILASLRESEEKFLLASCHGHSEKSEDGRLQISLVMQKFEELSQKPENKGLQLIIGTDANTKTKEDVELFRKHLDSLGLTATQNGPTTIKRRMVTTQHAKSGKYAIDEEDYLITLKPEMGGRYLLTNQTINFQDKKPSPNKPLPHLDNPSDHYPIGATLKPI